MSPTPTPTASTAATEHHDAVVVGGRLAGAATAMLLARRDIRVLVLERAQPGADTLSTHAMLRAGTHQLARWGLMDEVLAAGTPVVSTVRFHFPHECLSVPVKPGPGYPGMVAPRRTVLDPIVLGAATAAGAEVRHGTTVVSVDRDDTGRVVGVTTRAQDGTVTAVRAPIVVGADGARSLVARTVGAETLVSGTAATGVVYGRFRDVPVAGYEWGFAPGGAAGFIPTNDDETLVFASLPAPAFRARVGDGVERLFVEVIEAVSPPMAERVRAGRRASRYRSFPGVLGHVRRSHGPGWALVGDAGYFKDPISAHGMSDALRDAEVLADAVSDVLDGADEATALGAYQATRDALSADLFRVTDEMARCEADGPRLKELSIELSRSMTAEMEHLLGRSEPVPAVPSAA